MRITLGIALAAVLVGLGFYFNKPGTPPVTSPSTSSAQTPQAVAFRVLDTGIHAANISTKKNYAVYTAADFAKMWKMVHGLNEVPVPAVDFSKEYVLGVFAGQKPTGGYLVAVTSVADTANTRTVAVTLTKPGTGCVVNQMITNPYQLIAVPLNSASLTHTDTEVATPCK